MYIQTWKWRWIALPQYELAHASSKHDGAYMVRFHECTHCWNVKFPLHWLCTKDTQTVAFHFHGTPCKPEFDAVIFWLSHYAKKLYFGLQPTVFRCKLALMSFLRQAQDMVPTWLGSGLGEQSWNATESDKAWCTASIWSVVKAAGSPAQGSQRAQQTLYQALNPWWMCEYVDENMDELSRDQSRHQKTWKFW